MPSSPLIALWRARPFRPVALRLRDGRSILILTHEQLATSLDERRFAVVSAAGVESFTIDDVDSYDVLVATQRHVSYGVPEPEDDDPPQRASIPVPHPVPTHVSARSFVPTLKHAPAAPDASRQAGSSSSVPLPDAPQPRADPVAAASMHAAGLDYGAMQRAIFDAGEGRLHVVPTDDGLRLTQFTLRDRAGRNLLTTLGTRWRLFGLESFENGRAFHLVHADDPLLIRQVLIWPAVEQAKLDPFGSVMSLTRAREELAAIDAAARQSPRAIPVRAGYFESLAPKPTDTAPNSRWWENPAQPATLAPDAFTLDADPVEIAPHWFEEQLRLLGPDRRPVFDLTECGWFGEGRIEGDHWTLNLVRPHEGTRLELRMWPGEKQASLPGGPRHPMDFVQRAMRNYHLYDRIDVLRGVLMRGPAPSDQPAASIPVIDGAVGFVGEPPRRVTVEPPCHVLELWPGEPEIATPFLHPRLVDPVGRAMFDLRGSRWGAMIEWDAAPGALLGDPAPAFILRLINRDERERFGAASLRLAVHLGSCCVRGLGGEGSTSLGRLHLDAHHCVTPDMLLEWLTESLGRGRDLPW
ncbi:MAG: hypothetical protein HRU76_05495 [Phycisphaeraceae bacterium]|nr:hypothetical protein [Phycisphaerales bacterium]QOJ17070.1 MAG: hypothetical protein HRU76_05495 [Phycisphaeraceae bacterium]